MAWSVFGFILWAASISRATADSPFHIWFSKDQPRYAQKWSSFLSVYDTYLSRFRNTSCTLLELGVQSGGSQLMWLDYLGPKSRIYGADIEPLVAQITHRHITNFIGDIGNPAFLAFLCETIRRIDVIVDDASHLNWHQKLAFEALYPCLNPNGGIYIVEDVDTSYKPSYGGGWRAEGSFIEFAKAKVDELEAFWSCSGSVISDRRGRCEGGTLQVPISTLTRFTSAIHFHDGLVVFEKQRKKPSVSMEVGTLRLTKRFIGYSSYRAHLMEAWLPHMFGARDAGSCSAPSPYQGVEVYHQSVQSRANEILREHLGSLSLRNLDGELNRRCSDLVAVFQDGLYFSPLGMDFTIVQLKRRSFALEWNASETTSLGRFLRALDRDIKELLSWYFAKGSEQLILLDLLYRNRPRPWQFPMANAALQLQRDGFYQFQHLNLDIDDIHRLQFEVDEAFRGADPGSRVQRKSLRLEGLEKIFTGDILQLASFYLGADVKVLGYYLVRLKPGLLSAEYSSSTWHHDNCGSRLKLYIFLQDVREDGFYTEIARGSHTISYYWYGSDIMSRFDDASVGSLFTITPLFSHRGGGFMFDTNALHRIVVAGQRRQRDAVVVEIVNTHKLQEKTPKVTSCFQSRGFQVKDVGFRYPHRLFYQRRPGF